MLVVKVEVWSGGNPKASKQIGLLKLANTGDLTPVSDYVGTISINYDDKKVEIRGHRRRDGAWALIKKAIEQAGFG